MPKRAKSLEGKRTALKALNQSEEVSHIQHEQPKIYAKADAEVGGPSEN